MGDCDSSTCLARSFALCAMDKTVTDDQTPRGAGRATEGLAGSGRFCIKPIGVPSHEGPDRIGLGLDCEAANRLKLILLRRVWPIEFFPQARCAGGEGWRKWRVTTPDSGRRRPSLCYSECGNPYQELTESL